MVTLTDEQAQLLKGRNFASVGTVGPDGVPQVTPSWVDWDGEHVLLNTAEGRAKLRNIRKRPVISVCVVNHDNPYQYVSITGPAEISEAGAEEHMNELYHRYFGRDYSRRDAEKRLIVRVKPDRVFARGFE
jgi:PPOX class probable F420-dependent enzyme